MTTLGTARVVALFLAFNWLSWSIQAADLVNWQPLPKEWKGHSIADGKASLHSDRWAYLVSPDGLDNVEVAAIVTIDEPAKQFRFFGESWSVWPDHTFGDEGFEASVLLRSNSRESYPKDLGYRVQLSHKLQEVALVRFPDGAYLRSVPCEVKLKTPIRLVVSAVGNVVRVNVDGRELIQYVDPVEPALSSGQVGIGVSSAAKVTFHDVAVRRLDLSSIADVLKNQPTAHPARLRVKKWLGDRQWIFDGDEPILLLPSPDAEEQTRQGISRSEVRQSACPGGDRFAGAL